MQFTTVFCQTVTSSVLSEERIKTLFPETVCHNLDIRFPIVKVYYYTDKSGSYYCLLTESQDETFEDSHLGGTEVANRRIKAVNLKAGQGVFTKQWEINDFIIHNKYAEENSIWFWTNYVSFTDVEGDGLIDPIIVYGTREDFNYVGNGRMKIIMYHKGRKTAIRHQNGTLDGERETQIDSSFYELPLKMQVAVKSTMEAIRNNRHTIFPLDWEKQMKENETLLTE